jgi:hypothetical protein
VASWLNSGSQEVVAHRAGVDGEGNTDVPVGLPRPVEVGRLCNLAGYRRFDPIQVVEHRCSVNLEVASKLVDGDATSVGSDERLDLFRR